MKFKHALITAGIVVAGLGITTGKASAQSSQPDNKNKTEMTVKTPKQEYREDVAKLKEVRKAALKSASSKEERKQINSIVKEGISLMKEIRDAGAHSYYVQTKELKATR